MTEDAAQSPGDYNLAFRFRGESASQRAYFRVQELVERDAADLELSVYRLQRRDDWLVVLVGDAPSPEFETQVRAALSGGQPVTLEVEMLQFLRQRRASQSRQGSWVESHYRPGRGFHFEP